MYRWLAICLCLILSLTACQGRGTEAPVPGIGEGVEEDQGLQERHNAPIPGEYASLDNPVSADEVSLERGQEVYDIYCASCHGSGGLGDGPAGASTKPPASPIARTSQTMSDGYLFWRVSEGGVPFKTAMPAWKEVLDERKRWDVINYVQAFGQ